jgi:hypothetical protein
MEYFGTVLMILLWVRFLGGRTMRKTTLWKEFIELPGRTKGRRARNSHYGFLFGGKRQVSRR